MRNRISVIHCSVLLAAAALLLFASACQRAQLAEYKPYANEGEVPRISVEDAKKDYDSGIAVIIDSRDSNSFAQEHVKGAINIPNGSDESEYSKIPQGKKIIVYCSWPAEHTSASLAFKLNQKNIPETYALKGGTQGWKTAGYPMEGNGAAPPVPIIKDGAPIPPVGSSNAPAAHD